MIKIIKNQSGNVALAMLIAVIAVMSGLSISSMSLRDTIAAQAEFESIQSLHLLRAESLRGQAFLEIAAKTDPGLGGGLRTPIRNVPITGSHYKKTYTMQSHMYRRSAESEGYAIGGAGGATGATENEYLVRSLVETKTGVGQVAHFANNKSIVRKYSELQVFQSTGPIFMYFSDKDESSNEQNVYFYGPDVINGPLHSNSDITIKQLGGGSNQGWPTFLAPVTTSGVIISTPPQYPEETVFRGGLIENYPRYEFPTQMTEVRRNARRVGPSSFDEDQIIMITVDGSGYSGQKGKIMIPRRVHRDVWTNYPYGTNVPPLFRNSFTVRDTVWEPLPGGTSAGGSNFVNSKLWIRGNFYGFQTWGAADSLFLIGDITIQGTTPPADPYPGNKTSMVGLISEESIVVKYGFRDPVDSLRYHPNCGADNEYQAPAGGGIMIYAALLALGDGRGDPRKDGVFTFEYQHPHGSIPATRINVPPTPPDDPGGWRLFDWIDLHRFRFPQNAGSPWPPARDFPWYNPLWPERSPYLERGTINVWGGVNQRRRGFVHRSFYDTEWPSNGIWNPPMDFCGATSAPNPVNVQLYQNPNVNVTLVTRHWPGASGTGTGYKKNYNYDRRMYKHKPPDWPVFKKQGEKMPMEQGNWLLKRPPRSLV